MSSTPDTVTTATEHVPAGTVLQVAPDTLTLDENIRVDARLDEPFVESVRTHGVLVPIQVRQDPLGQLLVIDGQRRLLAAIQTDQASVPVVVLAGIGDDESRVTTQYVLNEQRAGLTASERRAAVEQLSLFGRTPKAIAKALGTERAEVEAVITVAAAPAAKALVEAKPDIDLVAVARIAEFADDPEIFEELAQAVTWPWGLDHRIESARQRRAITAAKQSRAAEVEQTGVKVVTESEGRELRGLTAVEPGADDRPEITPDEHLACPHRAVSVTGWWDDDEPTTAIVERCLDPQAAGHYSRWGQLSSSDDGAELSEEEKAAEESENRRRVRANNAASDAARAVRQRFILEQLTANVMPKDAVQHIDAVVRAGASSFTDYGTSNLWDEWIKNSDLKGGGGSARVATRNLLLRALATGEHCLERDFWRRPATTKYHTKGPEVRVLHLRYLVKHGYQLAAVEQEWLDAFTDKAAA